MAKKHAFIVRIWRDEEGRVVGLVSDPEAGWRYPVRNAAELWAMLSGSSLTGHPQPDTDSEGTTPHDE
ncbi:hypothetical protein GC175_32610 [bacterium]|nr:hypothetical protein [bacterium]